MRKIQQLCLGLILLLAFSSLSIFTNFTQASTTVLSLDPASIPTNTLTIGDTFQVTLKIADVTGLWAYKAGLTWDPTVLQVQGSPSEGPFLKTGGSTLFFASTPDNTEGYITEIADTIMASSGASGSGVLVTITFKVKGYGATTIALENTTLLSPETGYATPSGHQELAHTVTGSTFNLPDPSPTPTPTPSTSPTPTPSTDPSTTAHGPTANFKPVNGSTFYSGDSIVLDASQSTPGYDTTPSNETCPIVNYAWRIEFPNGTIINSFTGQTLNFNLNSTGLIRIILIITAPDPTLPSANGFTSTSSTASWIIIEDSSQLANIDVRTNKNGIGYNAAGGVFAPQELVQVYAMVTYRGAIVANKDVAFSIKDPQGQDMGVRVVRTNSTGYAYMEFRPPWSDQNPEMSFGTWSVIASVDVSQKVLKDTVTFNLNYIITTKSVQIPASVQRSTSLPINVTISSLNDEPIWSTLTITVYDEANVPIGFVKVENTNQVKGTTTISRSIAIPSYAFTGQATVYVDILTKMPDQGGIPYCEETVVKFQITA